jgi:hypothetical protein
MSLLSAYNPPDFNAPVLAAAPAGTLRQVFFYVVDMTEFSVDKLANRGSVQAVLILTNAQDFMVNLRHNLG